MNFIRTTVIFGEEYNGRSNYVPGIPERDCRGKGAGYL